MSGRRDEARMFRLSRRLVVIGVTFAAVFVSYFVVPRPWARAMYSLETRRAGLSKERINAIGREVAYLDGGSGEPVVMIHGFGADKYTWVRFAGQLSGSYRTVALDLPGFGETPALRGEHFDIEAQTTRAHEIIKALGIRRYHLIGNSMGGNIAGRIAHHWPEEVVTLVLSNSHGVGLGPSRLAESLRKGDNIFLVKTDAEFRDLTNLVFFKTPWIPQPIYEEQRDHAIATYDQREHMFEEVHPDRDTLLALLPEIKTKTLILWGDNDRLIDASRVKLLGEKLPNHRTVVMKDCGHVPPLERPEEAARHYREFVAAR